MRKAALALSSAIVVGLMLAMPVSAGSLTLFVADRSGDLGKMADYETLECKNGWGDNAPTVQAKYLDMLSMWLSFSQKTKTYTFGMQLAGDLPQPGTPLPPGVKSVNWMTYIEPEPWNPAYGYNTPWLFAVALTYDESSYQAVLLETGYRVIGPISFEVTGSVLEVHFSAASIGGLLSFWWFPMVMVVEGTSGTYWGVDGADPGAAPGQVWWDIPWPPL